MENQPLSDQDLLAQIAGGDERALRELFDRHAAWVRLRLGRRSPDSDLVDSAVQDTFVAVWRGASRYRGEADVAGWLWGIAVRRLIDRLRERRAPEPLGERIVAALAPPLRSAEDELLLRLENSDLAPAWDHLPAELRAALKATVIDGLTTREAASLLDIPVGTVKSRVRIGKRRLREQLLEERT